MKALYLSWSIASEVSSLSEPALRRLVKAGVLSPPLRIGVHRVGFEPEVFERELRDHVARESARLGPAGSAPSPTSEKLAARPSASGLA